MKLKTNINKDPKICISVTTSEREIEKPFENLNFMLSN